MKECKHKFGKIKDGYQYCKLCNKAEPVECNHKWVKIDEIRKVDSFFGSLEITYILQCKECGDIKTVIA